MVWIKQEANHDKTKILVPIALLVRFQIVSIGHAGKLSLEAAAEPSCHLCSDPFLDSQISSYYFIPNAGSIKVQQWGVLLGLPLSSYGGGGLAHWRG